MVLSTARHASVLLASSFWRAVIPERTSIAGRVRALAPPLLFGLRMAASVTLALYVAFAVPLDNAFWAATSAAVVCQPSLGASLRKGHFRLIGTVIGALTIVTVAGLWLRRTCCGMCGIRPCLVPRFT
jgi:Fusaric acid resistance protein family